MKNLLLSLLCTIILTPVFTQMDILNGPKIKIIFDEDKKMELVSSEEEMHLELFFSSGETMRIAEVFEDNFKLKAYMNSNEDRWTVTREHFKFDIREGQLEVFINRNEIEKAEQMQVMEAIMETFFVLDIDLREDVL